MHFCASDFITELDADLASAGWDGCLVPYPGETKRNFTLSHLRRAVLKKYVPNATGTTRDGDSAALKKFLAANERCRDWTPGYHLLNEAETEVIGEVKSLLWDFFNPRGLPLLTLGEISQGFNVGPGASIGCEGTDFYTKLSTSTLTATSASLVDYYQHTFRNTCLWGAQESLRHKVMGERIVSGNKLSFVPKYADISRVICTEPLLNMVFQKGIERLMLRRLRQVFGIDLVSQQLINRRLARVGALTGSFATIDLESASDTISMALCKELLPPEALRWFLAVRSPITRIPGGDDVELHMISSMGNATTFPLQTAIFSAITLAVYKVLGLRLKKRDNRARFTPSFVFRDMTRTLPNFAVNGDDIICMSQAYGLVVKILSWCGFVINEGKSFSNGPFRESCGADYFGSTNVRGAYIKHVRDVCDVFTAINKLNSWSVQHAVPLPRSIGYLMKLVRKTDIRHIPWHESDDSGLKVPLAFAKVRFDRNRSFIYRYWRLKPKSVRLDQSTARIRRSLPTYFVNECGLINSVLAGSIRAKSILQRQNRRDLESRVKHTPCWEWTDPAVRVSARFREDWYFLTPVNLGLQKVDVS